MLNVLQICLRIPQPPKDGGAIAMDRLSTGLLENNVNLKILAVNTPKHAVDVKSLPNEYLTQTGLEAVNINTDLTLTGAILSLLTPGNSYNISRFYNKEFENKIAETLRKTTYDAVILESLFMVPYLTVIRKNTKAKVLLRSHNVEFPIWEGLAEKEANPFKKIYLKHLAARLKHYELEHSPKLDGILTISDKDRYTYQQLGIHTPSITLLTGAKSLDENPVNPLEWNCIYHLGSMDWLPNLNGMDWFLENVWPKIKTQLPETRFYLAGRKMPKRILHLKSENLIVIGEVNNADQLEREKNLMVVPLFSGGGIRIKIIEGLSKGKVIITTPKGAEGIPVEHKKNILICNTADEMVMWIKECICHPEFCNEISKNALDFARKELNNKEIGRRLINFIQNLN